MTQPIQEPSTPRKLTAFGYGQEQLYRRPAPASGEAGGTTWAFANAEITGDTIDYVEPEFSTGPQQEFFRIDDGNWSLNGAERLTLDDGGGANAGLYRVDMNVHGLSVNTGVNTWIKVLVNLVDVVPDVAYWLPSQFEVPVAGTDVIETNFILMHDNDGGNFIPQDSAGGMYHNSVSWLLYIAPWNGGNSAVFRIRTAYIEDDAFVAESFELSFSVAKIAGEASANVIS